MHSIKYRELVLLLGYSSAAAACTSYCPITLATGLRCRKKKGVGIFLEPLKIITIRVTFSWECVSEKCGFWDSIHMKEMWVVS